MQCRCGKAAVQLGIAAVQMCRACSVQSMQSGRAKHIMCIACSADVQSMECKFAEQDVHSMQCGGAKHTVSKASLPAGQRRQLHTSSEGHSLPQVRRHTAPAMP